MTGVVGVRVLARVTFAAAVLFQLAVLYWPRAAQPGTPGVDKIVHAGIFGLVLLAGAWAGVRLRPLAAVLLAHAVLSELIQHLLLPRRSGDVLDAIADAAGVGLAWIALAARPRIRRHRVSDPADAEPARRG